MVYDRKTKERQKRWKESHKELVKEYTRRAYLKNKEEIDRKNRQRYHDNIECERERRKRYHDSHREQINQRHHENYYNNLEAERARSRDKYHRFKDKYNQYERGRSLLIKKFVISYYTNGNNNCECCGEKTFEFLSLDHVNGGGHRHRQNIGNIYRWLVRNLFPDGYRILCFNCNCARGFSGKCPHELKKSDLATIAK